MNPRGFFHWVKLMTIAGVLAVTASLTACGANNAMNDGRYNQSTRPVGYYSNDNGNGRASTEWTIKDPFLK